MHDKYPEEDSMVTKQVLQIPQDDILSLQQVWKEYEAAIKINKLNKWVQ